MENGLLESFFLACFEKGGPPGGRSRLPSLRPAFKAEFFSGFIPKDALGIGECRESCRNGESKILYGAS